MKKVIAELKNVGLTCLISHYDETVFTSFKRGAAPLIEFIQNGFPSDNLYLADKVIKKAAALLCINAGISYVFTLVISSPAKDIFEKAGISLSFENEVPVIQNRNKTGLYPMGGLSVGVTDPEEMYQKVIDWLDSE